MKTFLSILLLLFIFQPLISQTNSRQKSSKAKPVPRKTAVNPTSGTVTSSRGANKTSSDITVKDRIEKRIKDSASKPTSSSRTDTQPQLINGIRVTPQGASVNAISSGKVSPGAFDSTAATKLRGNQVGYPGTIPQQSGTGVNNSSTANRPVSGEQSQYNTTDPGRGQMNVINQNQNASSAQNTNASGWNQNTVGENQWGQNQVGEHQWTPPPAVISTGFGRDFPAIRNATWTMDNNKNYIARYKNGEYWTTSSYNPLGIRLETRTEIPITAPLPAAIITFKGRLKTPTELSRISRVERPGKPELYEVRLASGKTIHVDTEGAEVVF